MKHLLPHITICMALSAFLLAACQQEDAPLTEVSPKGSIVLSLSEPAAYIDVQTRAEQPLTDINDYDFTLSGTTAEGVEVADERLQIASNEAVIEAGTYTISVKGNNSLATQAVTGLGAPFYEGTSVDADGNKATFTVTAGGTTPVRILLKPTNAKLTISLTTAFTSNYRNITFTAGSRTLTLLTDDESVPTSDTEVTAYFPAGSLTVAAIARQGSQVTEIIPIQDAITLDAGTHNALSLSADPVTGIVIPTVSGEHTGEFD